MKISREMRESAEDGLMEERTAGEAVCGMRYSVLMPVRAGEEPEYLKAAIRSMLEQTVPPDELVIVCDGPLTESADRVLLACEKEHPGRFKIIRMKKSAGTARALNAGLRFCRNELVARMDSDDISLPDRCERQLEAFCRIPGLALLSGYIAEFETDPDDARYVRRVPCTREQIRRFARSRNPMNHMAVMYRRSEVEKAGGYIGIPYAEDYYLWARMLQRGCRAANLDTVLVKVRTGDRMYERRGGAEYAGSMYALQKRFLRMHFITRGDFLLNCAIRTAVSLVPVKVRGVFYKKRLRSDMAGTMGRYPDGGPCWETEMPEVHRKLLRMMRGLDLFLRTYGLRYWLAGGSVIGALRHNGFIPWDDDMDITLMRDEFDLMEELLKSGAGEPFIGGYHYEASGVREPIGRLYYSERDDGRRGMRIAIDIHPIDAVPSGWVSQRIQKWAGLAYYVSVYRKSPRNRGRFWEIAARAVLLFSTGTSLKWVERTARRCITHWNGTGEPMVCNLFGLNGYDKEKVPAAWFGNPEEHRFEDLLLPLPEKSHEYMTHIYGDYMELPPEDKRIPKHWLYYVTGGNI